MSAAQIIVTFLVLAFLAASFHAQQVWREFKAGANLRAAAETDATVTYLRRLDSLPPADWERPRLSLVAERCGLKPLTADEWKLLLDEPYDYERSGL